jgi:trafficking protein particle complex subunit 2
MSYYFTIIGPHDNPLFTLTFGTSKAGGDGIARFRNADVARHMNQFVTHASLDIVEEVMWLSGQMCVPLPSPCPSILLSNRDGAS